MALVPSGLPVADSNQVARIKLMLDIPQATTTYDQLLTMLYSGADQGVRSYLRRGSGRTVFASWPEQCSDTIYLTGEDSPVLIFPFQPVISVASVYLDLQGYGGQGTNSPFNASTLLVAGQHYILDNDDGTQSAKSTLRRLGGLNSGGMWGDWGFSPIGGRMTSGPLAMGGREQPRWPSVPRCIKVTATVGYATVPADLQQATCELTIFLYNTRKTGGMLYSSESLGAYSYSLLTNSKLPEIGTMRQQLARYRSDVPI